MFIFSIVVCYVVMGFALGVIAGTITDEEAAIIAVYCIAWPLYTIKYLVKYVPRLFIGSHKSLFPTAARSWRKI